MYKLRYYSTGQELIVKCFASISEALQYSIYKIPFMSFHSINKVEE